MAPTPFRLSPAMHFAPFRSLCALLALVAFTLLALFMSVQARVWCVRVRGREMRVRVLLQKQRASVCVHVCVCT